MGLLGNRKYAVPADDFGNPLDAMSSFITKRITLANTNRLEVVAPLGAVDAVITSATSFSVYESAAAYGTGNELGNGFSGTLITIPVTGGNKFWISGAANQVVNIMFPTLRG